MTTAKVKSRNIRSCIRYNGSHYYGFQKQADRKTVQGELETVLTSICGEQIRIIGAGRTDRGVHADGQVVSFKLNCKIPVDNLRNQVNKLLRVSLTMYDTCEAEAEFHARFSAVNRIYHYWLSKDNVPEVFKPYVMIYPREIASEEFLSRFQKLVLGVHDFSALAANSADQKSTICNLVKFDINKVSGCDPISGTKYSFWQVVVSADRFLYKMVRYLVTVYLEYCNGQISIDDIENDFSHSKQVKIKRLIPAFGLTLHKVVY